MSAFKLWSVQLIQSLALYLTKTKKEVAKLLLF